MHKVERLRMQHIWALCEGKKLKHSSGNNSFVMQVSSLLGATSMVMPIQIIHFY